MVSPETLENLIQSIPDQIKSVIKAKSYFLPRKKIVPTLLAVYLLIMDQGDITFYDIQKNCEGGRCKFNPLATHFVML
jgi:hypothetical protein